MILGHGRSAALAMALAAGLLASGCTKIQDRMGYVMDETLVSSVQPGVDNRDSVTATLGRPTFTGGFDQRDWYYISRHTKNMAFNMPHPDSQSVVRISFDAAGNVASVDRRGMEQVASINPSKDKTPTLGRQTSIIKELFGNIGAVGQQGQHAPTTDNPNGN